MIQITQCMQRVATSHVKAMSASAQHSSLHAISCESLHTYATVVY